MGPASIRRRLLFEEIRYTLDRKAYTCIIRDNARNYVAGLRDADLPNFGCFAHTLQLVIHDGDSRLVEQRTAILAAGAECACTVELRAQQWSLAEKVVRLLQPFEEATREVSGDYSSAGVIVPIVNSLKRALTTHAESTVDDHGITHMKQQMLLSLKQ